MSSGRLGQEATVCSTCLYDSASFKGLSFDTNGVCNICLTIARLTDQYQPGTQDGLDSLAVEISRIKLAGRDKDIDCVVGVSGGTDSSFLLMKAVDWGLRPLAVHFDNTWGGGVASQNIYELCSSLGVPLETYILDPTASDEVKVAFLRAGVPEFDADTDIAFVEVLRRAAAKHGVRYILEGHSFLTEGLSPPGSNYLDGRYVRSVYREFGKRPLRKVPNLTFTRFMWWTLVKRQVFLRPLWFIDYDKERARAELARRTRWRYYGGHHTENRSSMFAHQYYLYKKFGIDGRKLEVSAKLRLGKITRSEASEWLERPPQISRRDFLYFQARSQLSKAEINSLLAEDPKSWRDFKTYKGLFERLEPLFRVLVRQKLVPDSFYHKYCFPIPE